jgi:hypothetical protein
MASPDLPRDQDLIETIRGLRKPKTETDDGWIRVGSTSDEIAPPFENGWGWQGGTTVHPEFYLAPDGEVRMHGALDTGGTVPSVVFTLPEGFRPEKSERFVGAMSVGADTATIQVDPDGSVTIVAVGYSPAPGSVNPNVLDLTGGADGDVLTIVSGNATWEASTVPSPGSVVTTETTFGQSSVVGTNTTYSRSDHSHGTPADPIPPHVAASDPHTQYQLKSQKNAANGYAGLDGTTKVTTDKLGTGTADGTTVLMGDRVWRTLTVITSAAAAASLVITEAGWGQSAAVGTSVNYAREDHTHGTPPDPIPAHVAASDPHTQYQKESEKGAPNGYAGLGASTTVPPNNLGLGTRDGTKFLRDDGFWDVPSGGGGGGGATPASSVVSEQSFGTPNAVGTSAQYARADHTHGSPTDPVIAHVAATDPHPQYIRDDQINVPGGVVGIGATTGIAPAGTLGTGTPDITTYLRGDGVWDLLSNIAGTGGGSTWHVGAGTPSNSLGANGDMYLRDDGQVFQKTAGVWVDTGVNLSAGGTTAKSVMMTWAGLVNGVNTFAWRAPYVGSQGKVYTLQRIFGRVEAPGASATVLAFQKSSGGAAWSLATTFAYVTLGPSVYEVDNETVSFSFHSGDLIKVAIPAIGATGLYEAQLQAIETADYP